MTRDACRGCGRRFVLIVDLLDYFHYSLRSNPYLQTLGHLIQSRKWSDFVLFLVLYLKLVHFRSELRTEMSTRYGWGHSRLHGQLDFLQQGCLTQTRRRSKSADFHIYWTHQGLYVRSWLRAKAHRGGECHMLRYCHFSDTQSEAYH